MAVVDSTPTSKFSIQPLATFKPPSTTRAWQSIPHPHLPLIATASSDKSVRVYSLTSFTLISTITGGHKRSVRCCAWKPHVKGESVLATGSFDASAGIWRRYEPQGVGVKSADGDDDDNDDDVYVEQDFTRGDADDEEDYTFSVILDGHESEIKGLSWSASGQYLATCSRDKSVWIWEDMDDEGDNFETVAVLQEHEADVKCVAWHPTENLLASGSYDDDVRLWREDVDDWACCAALRGHKSTVWGVVFESESSTAARLGGVAESEAQKSYLTDAKRAGPRLLSCSDDKTVRVWKRKPKEGSDQGATVGSRMPSILRTQSIEEDWYCEAVLPKIHERAIYSVAWSSKTGLVVSTGSDGKIVVYRERWRAVTTTMTAADDTMQMDGQAEPATNGQDQDAGNGATEWEVVADFEGAHEVFEINHATWARRRDKGKRSEDEEIIITTGDDGEVKAWRLDSA